MAHIPNVAILYTYKKKTLEEDLSIALDLKSVYSGEIDQCGFVRIQ